MGDCKQPLSKGFSLSAENRCCSVVLLKKVCPLTYKTCIDQLYGYTCVHCKTQILLQVYGVHVCITACVCIWYITLLQLKKKNILIFLEAVAHIFYIKLLYLWYY